eukprot:TRINITY_DN1339_c0_g1_i1.p1 TRINITY_DN1339_c0_g1~~TRINITY_DN1339_c0_g1_i1.p1  ORF type:complete len:566 (-),score=94.44 TRINITY_DN1339_c0_g1_i1:16-1713(-)
MTQFPVVSVLVGMNDPAFIRTFLTQKIQEIPKGDLRLDETYQGKSLLDVAISTGRDPELVDYLLDRGCRLITFPGLDDIRNNYFEFDFSQNLEAYPEIATVNDHLGRDLLERIVDMSKSEKDRETVEFIKKLLPLVSSALGHLKLQATNETMIESGTETPVAGSSEVVEVEAEIEGEKGEGGRGSVGGEGEDDDDDAYQYSALDLAVRKGHLPLVKLLHETKGMGWGIEGVLCLRCAQLGHVEVFEYILEHGNVIALQCFVQRTIHLTGQWTLIPALIKNISELAKKKSHPLVQGRTDYVDYPTILNLEAVKMIAGRGLGLYSADKTEASGYHFDPMNPFKCAVAYAKFVYSLGIQNWSIYQALVGHEDVKDDSLLTRICMDVFTIASIGVRATIVGGTSLLAMDKGGTSDPYVKFIVKNSNLRRVDMKGKEKKEKYKPDSVPAQPFGRTLVVPKTLNPKWNHDFTFPLISGFTNLLLEVWDKDTHGKDWIGTASSVGITGLTDEDLKMTLYKKRGGWISNSDDEFKDRRGVINVTVKGLLESDLPRIIAGLDYLEQRSKETEVI